MSELPHGVRHCGIMLDNYDLYQDDEVTGSSFVVPLGAPIGVVLAELSAMRAKFEVPA